MVRFNAIAIGLILASASSFGVDAFTTSPKNGLRLNTLMSQTQLKAATLPPMIIGPMIKKMREKQEQKKMPMVLEEEAALEAPGLRVGNSAWKWPPIWPYDEKMFLPKEDIEAPPQADMSSMLGGTPPKTEQKEKLNPLKYWGEEKGEVLTELDPETAEKLRSHYAFYLKDGMSVLELGAAEESYLPQELQLSRHVGIGASQKLMDKNSALTESYVVDLNDVEEGRGVNSETLRKLFTEPFDVVLMANTIDFLTSPREVYKSAWYLLKPGGTMIVSFSNKEVYKSKFERAQTKIWRDYNDDQHMWVAGSLFHFSAGDGFENLRGFDISPDSAKDQLEGGISFFKAGKNNNLYVAMADKGVQDEDIDESDPEKSFKSRMWMLPTMEDRDKMLVSPRLRRKYEAATSQDERTALKNNVDLLPTVYESLLKMDQFAFTFSMQAQLATDLVSNPHFKASEEQIISMKQGLGLRTPSPEFWAPVGELTAAMDVEDKINLLAYIVPRFDSGNSAQDAALEAFVSALKPTFDVIRAKCPELSESDVQLLGTELLAAEVLIPGRSTRSEFALWLDELTDAELRDLLTKRKQLNVESKKGIQDAKDRRADLKAATEARQKLMQEQIDNARKTRSVTFNPRTGEFEEIPKDKKK